MSKDAQHDSHSKVKSSNALASSTLEVLLRLPDVRKLQSSSVEAADSSSKDDDDFKQSKQGPGAPHMVSPILDSLRRRWSTWKNAAMFAQIGVSTRFLVVGGLVVAMVMAAYLLIDRDGGGQQDTEVEQYNTAQQPTPSVETQAAATRVEQTPVPSPSLEVIKPPAAATARVERPPVARPPTARLELETTESAAIPSQPAIHVIETQHRTPAVYSADTRSRNSSRPSSEYRNDPLERPAARSGEHAKFQRYNESRNPGYVEENRRVESSYQPYRDPYAAGDRQPYPGGSRYDTPADRTRPNGAGFRGTIEPAPYRNR